MMLQAHRLEVTLKRLLPLLALALTGCQINAALLPEVLPVLAQVATEVAAALIEMEDSELGARIRLPDVQAKPTTGPVPEEGVLTSNKEAGPVHVEYRELPDGRWDIFVVNAHPFEVSTAFSVELDGYAADKLLKTTSVPANGRVEVARLRRATRNEARWTCRIQYVWGRVDAKHEDVVYVLPYGTAVKAPVGQPYFGTATHQGRHALDFTMPEGSEIRAARAGVVCQVVEEFNEGGFDESFRKKGNVIRIVHADGTLAAYAHLQQNGALVDVGDAVSAGQVIGRSGNTGYSAGPHLHFEVSSPVEIGGTKMLSHPTRFETAGGTLPGLGFKLGDRHGAI
jgi:hypothetical protein